MRRRHVLAALAGLAAAWPRGALSRDTPARIGFLAGGAAASINSASEIRTIKQGLEHNGLIEGRDYILEPRFAAGNYQRFPELAREFVQMGVSVILANVTGAASAVRQLAPSMPVVMIDADDFRDEFTKMIELQRAVLPNGASVAVLFNPANPPDRGFSQSLRAAAQAAGLSLTPIEFRFRNELEAAFATFTRQPVAAVHIMLEAATGDLIDRIPVLALQHKLPTFANRPEFASFGGLIGYGTPRDQLDLRVGAVVNKILGGAKPDDLPIAPPPRELWVNRNTARALGLTIPETLLATAVKILG
jgi:putative tryptophan/tyrosine transport system substrate-binding protein